MHHHVLLYHFYKANKHYAKLSELLKTRHYTFAMVDTSDDSEVLMNFGLYVPILVDIQTHCTIVGNNKNLWEKDTL